MRRLKHGRGRTTVDEVTQRFILDTLERKLDAARWELERAIMDVQSADLALHRAEERREDVEHRVGQCLEAIEKVKSGG
jgi:hypothetical protein